MHSPSRSEAQARNPYLSWPRRDKRSFSTLGALALSALLLLSAGCDVMRTDPAVLNGMVINDVNGRAVPAAVVQLMASPGNRVLEEVEASAEGRYSFVIDVDSSATFIVRAFKPGEFEAAQQQITVRAEQIVSLPDFRLAPTIGEVRPTVVTGAVVNDSTGVPLAGASVRIEDVQRRRVLSEVTTGADGAFELSFAMGEDRPLRLTAQREGFEVHTLDFDAEASQTYRIGDMRLRPAGPGILTGLIVNDATGQPVTGASVRIRDLDRNVVLAEVTASANGTFVASLALSGSTRLGVTITAEGYAQATRETTLTRGQTRTLEDIRLQAAGPGIISGLVISDGTSQPLAGASVVIKDLDRQLVLQETTTGSGGAFLVTLPLVGPTNLEVRVAKTGYEPATRLVTLTQSQTIVLDDVRLGATLSEARSITLAGRTAETIGVRNSGATETATLTFVVLDGRGQPINAANAVDVQFTMVNQPSQPGQTGAEFVYPEQARTDANGRGVRHTH